MTDEPTSSPAQVATANVKQKSSGFSPVWIIPIVAALIGGWMVFKSALDENTIIQVSFNDASGIVAGKTVVKFRDIDIGKVTAVDLSEDLSDIVLTLEFADIPAESFNEETRFWVVRPRVGLGGVTGLETLLSGAYIEVDPSGIKGTLPVTKFVGLEQPEIRQLGNPGTSYRLKAGSLGSLKRNSPVKYRDISVGLVTRYELAEDHGGIDIDIFIREPFDKLVKRDTRFWDISGLQVEAGAQGVKLSMDSVTTLIGGGIAFANSESTMAPQAEPDTVFTLHETEKEDVQAEAVAKSAIRVPLKLYFEQGVKGLEEGAPLEYKGLRVGTVTAVSAEYNDNLDILQTFALAQIEPARLPSRILDADHTDEERITEVKEFFETIAARGVRAQLRTGNLITGKSVIVFDEFPDAKPEPVRYVAGTAVYPTVPRSLEDIQTKIDAAMTRLDGILTKLDKIPIVEIGNDLAQTMDSINAIPIEEIGNNLAQTSAKIEAMPYGEISKHLDDTLANLDALIESLNASKGGVIGVETRRALEEITKAAGALRGMAEYLERHPEALLKGKRGP